jgi:hypothetical protein
MIANTKGRVVLPGVARLAFRGPARLSRPASPPPQRQRTSPASLKAA